MALSHQRVKQHGASAVSGYARGASRFIWWNTEYTNYLSTQRQSVLIAMVERILRSERPASLALQEVVIDRVPQLLDVAEQNGYRSHFTSIGRTHDRRAVHGLFLAVDNELRGSFAELFTPKTGLPIQIFNADAGITIGNTHFPVAFGHGKGRVAAAEFLAEWLADSSAVRLIGGDFNALAWWPMMSKLRGYRIAADTSDDRLRSWAWRVGPMTVAATVDHVLCNFDVRDAGLDIHRTVARVSDHYPIALSSRALGALTYADDRSLITDQYSYRRGDYSRLLTLNCRGCRRLVAHYQKDGPGPLLRCYFDRLHLVSRPVSASSTWQASPEGQWRCAGCERVLGEAMVYAAENRAAFRLFSDAFVDSSS